MTIGRARSLLSLFWGITTFPLFVVFIIQDIQVKYGADWDTPWTWFLPLVMPVLSLIVGVWVIGERFNSTEKLHSPTSFYGAIFVSFIYITLLYLVVCSAPFSNLTIEAIFRSSGWYLGVIQGLLILVLHKFLIENAPAQEDDRRPWPISKKGRAPSR
jgi:hypothetical protein